MMREHKTPREITIVLHSRDGWTIPQIAEISHLTRDLLTVELDFWDEITGKAAAEAVKAILKRDPSARGLRRLT